MMSRTQLTPDLFFDLIDRRLTAIDICNRHELTFDQLEDVVQSHEFQEAAARLKSVEQTRCTATDTLRRTAALRVLEDIAAQQPSCPTHTETIRLAAAQILRVTRADPAAAEHSPQQPDPYTDPQPDPPGRAYHPEPQPEPEPISDWPDETYPAPDPGPIPSTPPDPNPDPNPVPYPEHNPEPHPPQPAANNAPAHDLISRAGATQPFTSQPIPGRDAPNTTTHPTHKRAPPVQPAA